MSEFDRSSLAQPVEVTRPSGLDIFNVQEIYSSAGFPFFARDVSDYNNVGGLRLEPYTRGDSPSRDNSELPYNATWFEHLRKNYGGALKLLESLRGEYIRECTSNGELDATGILEVYHMGIHLPNFLMWRQNNSVPNGEIPAEMAVLRQALLGVGTVILHVDKEKLENMDGKEIAEIAENNGDLVSEDKSAITSVPTMVCPASPEMIAGLGDALLAGNTKREGSDLLAKYEVDINKLRQFVTFIEMHSEREIQFLTEAEKLFKEPPQNSDSFSLQKPKTKVERYDELVAEYGRILDIQHPILYASLDRTDQPPKMNIRRLYKIRIEFLRGRVKALESDHPRNITKEAMIEMRMFMPSTSV